MPKKAKALSAKAVEKLTSDGTHAVGGVDGLLLQVRGENARSWVLRVRVNGQRRVIGLGSCADLSLAAARRQAEGMRASIAQGGDPLAERRQRRVEAASCVLTFDEAARRLIAAKSVEWSNAKHKAQWKNTLATYASPHIGKMAVSDVTTGDVLRVLEPIWFEKTETAKRVQLRIEAVLDWATAADLRTGDNPARWRGKLDKLLAKPGKVTKVRHHSALPADAMHTFVADLRKREGTAARALELLILTATRSGEVRGAKWSEIDLDAAVWTIPGERMKAGREHRVPLCERAVEILRALPRRVGTDLVFPAPRGGQLSDMALLQTMRRMKADAVPHGFRSTFRDWASERTNYSPDVAEMALAHTIKNKTEAAYRRGDLFAKRARMMAEWQKFIETKPATGNVVSINERKTA